MGDVCTPEEVAVHYNMFQAIVNKAIKDYENGDISMGEVERFCNSRIVELFGINGDYLFRLIMSKSSR